RTVLFLIFGSSCSGKTTVLDAIRERGLPRLEVHDFDEIGVPRDADGKWRQGANEIWVTRALAWQAAGLDLLLAGQTPLGELLATPSAVGIDAISACLLDCDDEARLARLAARPADWMTSDPKLWPHLLNWARWMREHAADPESRAAV